MSLEPYTNTYTDTDGSIADADDIVNEFDRVEAFINAWSDSYESIGNTSVTEKTIITSDTDIEPSIGLIQSIRIDPAVETVNFNILQRSDGDPYRIYIALRFGSLSTRFTVSAPASKSHIFALNQTPYSPSQVVQEGYYPAVMIVTYGTDATHLQVYADNQEDTLITLDDILQGAAV